jgi:carboxylesterase type B
MRKRFIYFQRYFITFFIISDEIMFVFGEPLNTTDNKVYKYEEVQLARRIMGYWTNFAKYG